MKHLPFLLFIALAFHLQADALSDKVKVLNDALKTAATANGTAGRINRYPLTLAVSTDMENDANVESQLQNLLAQSPSPEVEQAAEAVMEELKAQRKVHFEAYTAKIDAVIARIPDALAKAQKPEDLDDIIGDIGSIEPNRAGGFPFSPEAQARRTTASPPSTSSSPSGRTIFRTLSPATTRRRSTR